MSLIKPGNVLVVDSKLGTVVSAATATKDIKVVAGKGEGLEWLDAVSDGSRVLILNPKGVSVNGKETGGVVFDMAVSKAVAIGRFGANLYVLDSGNKEIYKYGAVSDGYGDRVRWLAQDQTISVVPVDIAIDSDVWILGDNGVVERFRRGLREQFVLSGVPDGAKTVKIAVQLDGSKLAMLDVINGRVIVCSKETGNCEQQLMSEKLKMATDIEYDEEVLLVLVSGTVGVLN
jgi:DNA-binding beta-propeller fold protein YncE